MCGIAGFWSKRKESEDRLRNLGQKMSDAIRHRGPDAEGHWVDSAQALVFAHRRLAILDISAAGAQPMESVGGRFKLVFNGEIYNHLDIRQELNQLSGGGQWRGSSDTETLLAAIERWGLEGTLQKCFGMFALALWDSRKQRLSLARDRVGEKPLYYVQNEQGVAFASELQALRAIPGLVGEVSQAAVHHYLRYTCVPDSMSIYAGVKKLPAGSLIHFESVTHSGEAAPYWRLETVARQQSPLAAEAANEDLEAVLMEVVRSQMLSDVPLGAFLSGGIDSSLITALMQQTSAKPVHTYSIGFEQAEFDESHHAALVASHIGTLHKEFKIRKEDVLDLIPQISKIYDEPFADSSQLPTTLLCRAARQDVTVALTGDGGDEVFGGYNRYLFAPKAWRRASSLPGVVRRRLPLLARALQALGGANSSVLRKGFERAGLPAGLIHKMVRLATTLGQAQTFEQLYTGLVSTFDEPAELMVARFDQKINPVYQQMGQLSPQEWMMLTDSLIYLPSDILVKVDRASMSTSLETRAPLLDARVIETAWRMPIAEKISSGVGKQPLRELLYRYVPEQLVSRPKQGFAIPLDDWLRTDLADWVNATLTRERIVETGVLHYQPVQTLWHDHQRKKQNNGQKIWAILNLLTWLEDNG